MSQVTEEHLFKEVWVRDLDTQDWSKCILVKITKERKYKYYCLSNDKETVFWWEYAKPIELLADKPVNELCLNKLCEFSNNNGFEPSYKRFLFGKIEDDDFPYRPWISTPYRVIFGSGYSHDSWSYCRRLPDVIYGDENE